MLSGIRGPLLFDPGERLHYRTSTGVVGRLVEVVSGQELEDYFCQHIFAPLKMDDTSYNVPEVEGTRLVAQQQRAGERMDGTIELQKPQLGLAIAAPISGGLARSLIQESSCSQGPSTYALWHERSQPATAPRRAANANRFPCALKMRRRGEYDFPAGVA